MEKQIFISKQWVEKNTYCSLIFNDFINDCHLKNIKKESSYFFIIGILNQYLGDRANCKEIVAVVNHTEINSFREETEGYLITYLESEMIASKDDLETVWYEGKNCGRDEINSYTNFEDWFNKNFA